jgi:hypothetical protein
MNYIVVCHDPNDTPMLYGLFASANAAEQWIVETAEDSIRLEIQPCTNEHDVVSLNEIG